MKIKNSRKRYSEEFKINALKLLDESNRNQKVLVAELGISVVTLGQWKRRYGTAVVEARLAVGKKGRNSGDPAAGAFECVRLQRELDHMTRQRDILKKGIGHFQPATTTLYEIISILHHPIAEPQTPDPVAYCIAECCEALEVSRSGYYDHLAKPERLRRQQN